VRSIVSRCALREELIAEVIANAFTAFRRLLEPGKIALAYPTALARFAIRQVREGRRVGSPQNTGDVFSSAPKNRQRIHLQPLHQRLDGKGWEELLIEDRRSTPAEIAACRLDFRAWLRGLSPKKRAIAARLATGESTNDAAQRLGVSVGRISQLRRELRDSWCAFQGELAGAG
jgi:DNA-directed RNA polymerase specialized sigma24 family protein